MPNVKNQDPSGKLEAGAILTVSDVASENDAILAVENYLRVNKKEGLELSVLPKGSGDTFEIKVG